MQPKARMTFRFDPPKAEARPPLERPQPVPAAPREVSERTQAADRLNSSQHGGTATKRDAYYTGGPLQDDPYTLEEMIRQSEPIKLLTAKPALPFREVAEDDDNIEAEWKTGWSPMHAADDSPEETAGEHPEWQAGALTRRHGPSWWRVFASVAGAVATGALFGYLVLTLFTGDSPFPAPPGSPRIDTPAQAPANSTAAGGSAPQATATRSADPGKPASGRTTTVAESSFYLLQFGVFGTEASMKAAVQELKNKGLPHAADLTDGYRVYAGAAETKEEAEQLAGRFSEVEVYVKPAVGEAIDAGAADWLAFIDRGTDLTRRLARLSADALQQGADQAIDPETMKALGESHRLWLQSVPAAAKLKGTARQSAKTMETALSAAMVSVDDYTRKMSRLHLMDVQSHVTQAILAERSLRAAIRNGFEK